MKKGEITSKRIVFALKYLKKDLSNDEEVTKRIIDKFGYTRDGARHVIRDIRKYIRLGMLPGYTIANIPTMHPQPFRTPAKIEDYKPSNIIKVSQMRDKYSLPSVIKRYLSHLNDDELVTEAEMRSDIEITRWQDYKTVLDLPEWEKYKGKIRNLIYWGNPKAIKDLKSDKTLKPIIY
jgi:hypothetical protein